MSEGSTNTPSGDSKRNLYEESLKMGIPEINFLALEERDPARGENTSDIDGANSSVIPVEIGTIDTGNIQRVGYVGIVVSNCINKDEYENRKNLIKKKAEQSKEDHDRDKDGIEDRNQ